MNEIDELVAENDDTKGALIERLLISGLESYYVQKEESNAKAMLKKARENVKRTNNLLADMGQMLKKMEEKTTENVKKVTQNHALSLKKNDILLKGFGKKADDFLTEIDEKNSKAFARLRLETGKFNKNKK